ncbi:MAG TPA: hypothetical protein VN736_25830 [Candidatus Limnocylindrales bacterium]|nr:hypothetical protein [Candidatus Limnocylindrales bacterium]
MATAAASLRALLARLIDYAGLFPPAGLPLTAVVENYSAYLASSDAWILNRLVLPAAKLAGAQLPPDGRLTLLVESEPSSAPPQVETFESKFARPFSRPTYYELPLDAVPSGGFAKVRTGGLTPDMIPPTTQIAGFLMEAARRRVPFKATAGLHHPLRSLHPLTYAGEAPHAVMHGFINVFTAAAFAWHGAKALVVADVLNDVDATAFSFTDAELRWRGRALSTAQIEAARREFAHSFGSCSFEEPLADLRELGWL